MKSTFWQRAELALSGPLPAEVRRNMRIELLASVFFGPFYAVLLFIPVILQRLNASPEQVALYQSETYFGFLLSAFSVMLLPRRGILRFLMVIWTIGRAAFLLTPLVPTVVGVLVIALVYWLSDSFPSPGYVRVVQQIYPAGVRARAMSVVRFGMAAGMLAATPVAGWLLDTVGYTVLLPLGGLFGVAAALIFARIRMPETLAVSDAALQPRMSPLALFGMLRNNKPFAIFLLSITAFGFAGLIPIAFYPAVLVNRLHLSYTTISLLGFAQSIVWLLGYALWGRWMSHIGTVATLRIVFLLLILYPLCHWFAPNAWWLLPAYIASGLASAGVDLAFTNTAINLAEPNRVAEYSALQQTVIGFRGIIGPLLGVQLNQLGVSMPAIFVLSIVLYLVAAGLTLFVDKRKRAES
ncbi:MAG: MFS transporter [Chloroflexi bacterium]|nr:MFS transporter [Chloroflexota bacterium]